jgi:tetratricopeptide (TPR) repeat protein
MVFFKLRGNKLNMSVINRSNDLHWGLYSANIMQFSMMQRILASCLHVELGIYRHFSDSLHIYIDNDEISPRIINSNYEYNVYDYFKSYDLSNEYKNLADFDIKLSRFFYEEESLRKGINIIPNDFDIGKFLSGALYILSAYVWHKKSHYEESLNQLLKAFDLGLCDHVISSLEFVMRKYQKIDNEFANKQLSKINKHFIDLNLNTRAVERTLHYIKTH